LEGYAQLAIIGIAAIVMLAAAWIMRERLRKWAREVAS
jgi:hypothetical protein